MKSLLKKEDGQTLVLTALCASVLLGFVGLALDVGVLFHARRSMQTAADAAALAGAIDYLYHQSASHARTAACNAATRNGFSGTCTTGTCADGTAEICINVPPVAGPNSGTVGFVEAIVTKPTATIFHPGSVNVAARAVGALPLAGQACIWVMAPSGPALNVQGSYDIESQHCGVYVNSDTSDAMNVTGNSGTFNTTFIDVVGNSTLQHTTTPTAPTMNSGARQSPWGNLNGPCWNSTSCDPNNTGNPATNECSTGAANVTSTNNISLASQIPAPNADGVVCFSGGNVKLSGTLVFPGGSSGGSGIVYVFENGVTMDTGSNVTFGSGSIVSHNPLTFGSTAGAVLDVGGGTLTQKSNSILNIWSPADSASTYDGIAIFQPTWNTNQLQVQFGSNNEVLDGYIYAPGAAVSLQDNGGGVTATGIVANQLLVGPSGLTVANSYDRANATTTLNRVLTLVE
jgi:hypothetical protein